MEDQRPRGTEKSSKTFQIIPKDKQHIRQIYYNESGQGEQDRRGNSLQANHSPSKLKPQMQGAQQQNTAPNGVKSRNREIQSNQNNNNQNLSGQYKQKQSQSVNLQKPKQQMPAGGQFHVVHHNGTNINNILQNPMLQNILSQNSGSKQQIIIVQSGGQTSQAINNLIQSQQQNSGGQQPQAISLSGLTMQELNGILNAYGLTDTQGQLNQNSRSISLQPMASHNTALAGQTHIQQPSNQHQMVGQQTNINQHSQLVSQGTGISGDTVNLGQQLQQQIEQLQAQNQLMQQQILQNVGIGLGDQGLTNANIASILQPSSMLGMQQNQPQNLGMSNLIGNIQQQDPIENLNYQLMNQNTTQQQRQMQQQQQINSLQKQIMQLRNNQQNQGQFYNPNIVNIGSQNSNQIIDQQIQQLQSNQNPLYQQMPCQQMPQVMNMTQQQLNNIVQSNYNSSTNQKGQNQFEQSNKTNDESLSFVKPVLQTKQPWGSQISSVIQTQKTKKKKELMVPEELNKQTPALSAKKKNIIKQDSKMNTEYSSLNDNSNKQKSQNKKISQQKQQQVDVPSNQSSRHYQSATYRQNEPQSQSNSQANNYMSKNGTKQMQSPIIAGSRGSVTTQKDQGQQQLIDSSDKLIQKIRNNKKKLKSKQITADILQTPPAMMPNQSRNEVQQNNNQNENSKRLNQSGSKQKESKDDQVLSRNRLQKSNQISSQVQTNAMLNLPPPAPTSPPALTAKEKKRLRLEKEKERQLELFEKNFKRESLYICKMALNVQKSFITKPTAIIVYHQHRLVKLDITQNNLYQQTVPSAVPQLAEQKKPLLITPEQVNDFYLHSKVRKYKLVNRNLEVIEEPNYLFKEDQQNINPKQHTIQERKIREVLDEQLAEKELLMKPEKLAENPIVFPSGNIKDTTIFFNSRFESGNLREVEKVGEMEYNCYVNFDFNSTVHSQWYYFSVRNIAKGKVYKFNIMNLQKDESCYQIGMKPFVYSTKQNREAGTNEWKRGGEQVCYYKNKLQTRARECAPDYEFDEDNIPCYEYEDEASRIVTLNTLSFCYEFQYENDITYFAYFQPYSLSDLEDYQFQIQKNYDKEHLDYIYKCEKLCDTLGGKPCYVLTITDNVQEDDIKIKKDGKVDDDKKEDNSARNPSLGTNSMSTQKKNENQAENDDNSVMSGFQMAAKNKKDIDDNQKQTIFLTGRVHPGESNASFMIQGAIDFLLQKNNKEAKMLREQFIFKIVPMLNPDGVVNGHYRCNYIGADLNRRWPNPSKLLHPTIYYTKKLLKMCHQDNQVLLFCDFHGHTRKRNVFMYGCVSQQTELNQHKNNNLIRIVPYLLDQKNKCFSFQDCKFANEKEKESTGRLVMFKEFGILNSYTIESTFYSCYNPRMGQKKKVNVDNDDQIKIEELYQIGNDFCETLMSIINSKILKRKFITDTTTPLGNFCPGQGGNPISNFFVNQQNELNAQKQHQNNSMMYNQQNNVQSVLKNFINGPSINPYSLIGGPTSIAANSQIGTATHLFNQSQSPEKKAKQKAMAKSQNDSMIQQFNSSREAQTREELPEIAVQDLAVPLQQNAQNSTNSSCRKQSVAISGPTISSQSLYMGYTPNKAQRISEKDISQEDVTLTSFQEQNQPQRPLLFDPKKNHNHSSHNVQTSRKADDPPVSCNTTVHLTQGNIENMNVIHQSNTPQFHHNENYEHMTIPNLSNLQRLKKHSFQQSTNRFRDSIDKQGATEESKLVDQHALINTDESHEEVKQSTINKNTESDSKNSKTMIEIQLDTSDKSETNIEDQNLMGPEQMNILDQYINKSNQQIKQNKAASLEQSISTPNQQLVEQQHIARQRQTKQETTFKKAQTFACQNQQNNLYPLDVGFGGQNQHNTPNSKNTSNVLKIKSSEVAGGTGDSLIKINKSRLSAQVASSSKTNNHLIRQTEYQQQNNAGSFFTSNAGTNQAVKRQSSSSMKPNKTNQNFHNAKTRDLMTDDMNSEQYNMFGLRDQKQSKSSLAMTSSNFKNGNGANLKNIIVQNIHTPIKENQKGKQKKYNQTLVNSAGNNMIKPSSMFEQPFQGNTQAQLQNFLPQQSNEQSEITVQLQNKYQALQQRKYAEVISQQISKDQMTGQQQQPRQSYQSNPSNSAEINFKRKYGVTAVTSVIDNFSKFQSSQLSHDEEIHNNYQNLQNEKTSQGTGVLPKINQEPGSRRITQGYNDVSSLRPNSQSRPDATPQYPHRNILTNMTGQSSIASAASNQPKQFQQTNGVAYSDQMQFNNYTNQVHDAMNKSNSNRRDQPVSIRVKGKSTKNLST